MGWRERVAIVKKYQLWLIVGFVLAAIALAGLLMQQPSRLTVTFFDVGQGDGAHIRLPGGVDVVIDGGSNRTAFVRQLRASLAPLDRTIELLISTHPDADHLGGLLSVVEQLNIEKVLVTNATRETKLFADWQAVLRQKGVTPTNAVAGQVYHLPGATLTVLWPRVESIQTEIEKTNDLGVVVRLDVGQTCVLFTADIAAEVELQLPATQIDCEVLKVAHHGSKYSSAEAFVNAVSPELSIISVGAKNRYGHPGSDVVKRLEAVGSRILRTDQAGTIRLIWKKTGEGYSVKTER